MMNAETKKEDFALYSIDIESGEIAESVVDFDERIKFTAALEPGKKENEAVIIAIYHH